MIKRRRECSYAVLLFFIPFFLQKILQSLQEFQVSLRNLQRGVGCFLSRSLYKNRHSCSLFQWTAECITNIREKLRVVCSKLVLLSNNFFTVNGLIIAVFLSFLQVIDCISTIPYFVEGLQVVRQKRHWKAA